ncbi:uncharacterized protein LOC127566241 [Drosophila albomicans]|uniref:Uncharacterized protein LOC127566241 n=1 Tax=Drosophila albomicans TaxID=7291 RepID=A0A9C6WLZ0_DROAB|nr:uncharacterized protein LOC127566241 [Drosophila albomicans]
MSRLMDEVVPARLRNEVFVYLDDIFVVSSSLESVKRLIGLLFKIKNWLPAPYYLLLRSYLSKRCFYVQQRNDTSTLFLINAGVPQGSVLGPVLYTLYTADMPATNNCTIATYADDTAILATLETKHLKLLQKQSALAREDTDRRRQGTHSAPNCWGPMPSGTSPCQANTRLLKELGPAGVTVLWASFMDLWMVLKTTSRLMGVSLERNVAVHTLAPPSNGEPMADAMTR